MRFAAGTGLRLSLVNLDLTIGYALTLQPGPKESRGALFFTFGVSNLSL